MRTSWVWPTPDILCMIYYLNTADSHGAKACSQTETHKNTALFGFPADSSKENPYEDIELESQCSQQSLPSSPGADSTKVAAEHTRHRAFIQTLF